MFSTIGCFHRGSVTQSQTVIRFVWTRRPQRTNSLKGVIVRAASVSRIDAGLAFTLASRFIVQCLILQLQVDRKFAKKVVSIN